MKYNNSEVVNFAEHDSDIVYANAEIAYQLRNISNELAEMNRLKRLALLIKCSDNDMVYQNSKSRKKQELGEPYKRKYSILDLIIKFIREHREKDATPEELEKLSMNYRRAVLKAGIAKEKHEARKHSRFTIIAQNFIKNVQTKSTTKSKKSKKTKTEQLDSDKLGFHGLSRDELKKLKDGLT